MGDCGGLLGHGLAVMYKKSMSIALAGRQRVSLGARSIELDRKSNHNWSPSEQSPKCLCIRVSHLEGDTHGRR